MRKLSITTLIMCLGIVTFAQGIKGPESISYFQAPSAGVKFAKADVYMSHDKALEKAKLEEQQAKNAEMGAKFGALGSAVAAGANKGMAMLNKVENAVREFQDDKGRFAIWNFVPEYIIAKAETEKSVMVEIFILNEPNPSPSARMPTTADKNGYYDVPYYINCRYKITDPRGVVVLEDNLGVLQGTQKTKNYTPPPPAQPGITVTVEESDELSASERIGINKAYNRVRQEVFARYGFGQFSAPIKLGVIKEIKESKKLIKPTLAVFEGKKGLLLSKDDKVKVQQFVDLIEKNISLCSDDTRWVAYHNLSVCYAWLEQPEKAKEAYGKYAEEIKETLLKMECWNKILQGKMKGSEMKEKVGTTFIGMKDQKKYEQYNNINCFVNYYAAGAVRYEKLFYTLNRDLAKFTDYYAHNDLLCQLFEIDYPFQFFPLNEFNGLPKDMVGVVTREGMEPINFNARFDSKRRISELEASQITILDDGSSEKLISRELKPIYSDETGEYLRMETDAGSWVREMARPNYFVKMNSWYDPIDNKTYGQANNITKNAGFMADRTSDEDVRLKVDLEGNIYFTGKSSYFKANAVFKDLLSANGIVPKRVDTKTSFTTKANINEFGVLTNWKWDGTVSTNFSRQLSGRTQSATAKKMVREINFTEVDDKGNPKLVDFNFQMAGSMKIESKVSMKEYFSKYVENNGAINGAMNYENFNLNTKTKWNCEFKYDEQGNWIEMKVGPYTATRTFKY